MDHVVRQPRGAIPSKDPVAGHLALERHARSRWDATKLASLAASPVRFHCMQKPSLIRLDWPGKSPAASAIPGRLQRIAEGDGRFTVVRGDNAIALSCLAEHHGGRAALVYLDPPFFTGRQHLRVVRRRDGAGRISRKSELAFDDRWDSLSDYLEQLQLRLAAARDLLSPDGSLVLHVDPKTSHYARVLLDEVFGPDCFVSEVIWRYRRWPSKTPNYQRVHDVLLRYVRDAVAKPKFNQLFEPLAASTIATWGTKRQRAQYDDNGRRRCSSTTEEPSPGVPLGDVWDIGIVAPVARERTGYPTQKPEALLTRLVESLTMPGDWVIDPYLGSGTTLAVCARLGRRATGIDDNPAAIEVTKKRLAQLDIQVRQEQVLQGPALRKANRTSHNVDTSSVA
jgi:DNA modification methylase